MLVKNCKSQRKVHSIKVLNHKNNHRKRKHDYKKLCGKKWKKRKNKEEYKKRTSVEEPYRVLKQQFNIEKEVVVGIKSTTERLNLDCLAYNLKRLYNIKKG